MNLNQQYLLNKLASNPVSFARVKELAKALVREVGTKSTKGKYAYEVGKNGFETLVNKAEAAMLNHPKTTLGVTGAGVAGLSSLPFVAAKKGKE